MSHKPLRRFLLLKPEKKESLDDENLFGYFLDGLSEPEWKLSKDTLDAQPNLDCDEKLDVLQQFWEKTPSLQSNQEEGALVEKTRWPKSRLSRKSDENLNQPTLENRVSRSPSNRARGSRCYQCKSEEHRVDTCPYVEPAKQWAYQQRMKDEKYGRKNYLSSPPTRQTPKKCYVHFKSEKMKNIGRAYTACSDGSGNSEDIGSIQEKSTMRGKVAK